MRIDLIGPSWFPLCQPFVGGLEAFVWHLARGLVARGHQVRLHAPAGTQPPAGCEVIEFAAPTMLGDVAEQAELDAVSYRQVMADVLAGDADVVHNNALHPLPVKQSLLGGPPMLTTLHTPPLRRIVGPLRNVGARHHVVAVSRALRSLWPLRGIEVVPNGVDTDLFTPGAGGEDLLWAGRITPEKGTHLAIDTARSLGRSIRLVGSIYDEEYFAEVIRPELGPEVQYLGPVPQDELPGIYGSAGALLVTPCWDEPFGMVAAEAIACGTPVAALRRGGLPEVVSEQVTGCFAQEPGELAGAVEAALGLNRRQVAMVGRRDLSLDRMVTAYERLYRSLSEARADVFEGARV